MDRENERDMALVLKNQIVHELKVRLKLGITKRQDSFSDGAVYMCYV